MLEKSRHEGLSLRINLCEMCVCYYMKKNKYTLGMPRRWGDFINYSGNISIQMVELAKLKLCWDIIVSFPGIRYICTGIKMFTLVHTCRSTNIFSLKLKQYQSNSLASTYFTGFSHKWVYYLLQTRKNMY